MVVKCFPCNLLSLRLVGRPWLVSPTLATWSSQGCTSSWARATLYFLWDWYLFLCSGFLMKINTRRVDYTWFKKPHKTLLPTFDGLPIECIRAEILITTINPIHVFVVFNNIFGLSMSSWLPRVWTSLLPVPWVVEITYTLHLSNQWTARTLPACKNFISPCWSFSWNSNWNFPFSFLIVPHACVLAFSRPWNSLIVE